MSASFFYHFFTDCAMLRVVQCLGFYEEQTDTLRPPSASELLTSVKNFYLPVISFSSALARWAKWIMREGMVDTSELVPILVGGYSI